MGWYNLVKSFEGSRVKIRCKNCKCCWLVNRGLSYKHIFALNIKENFHYFVYLSDLQKSHLVLSKVNPFIIRGGQNENASRCCKWDSFGNTASYYHTTAQCKPEIHGIEWDRIAENRIE